MISMHLGNDQEPQIANKKISLFLWINRNKLLANEWLEAANKMVACINSLFLKVSIILISWELSGLLRL